MSNHVLLRLAGAGCVTVVLLAAAGTPSAQIAEQRLHLNPVIAKLADGRTVYGLQAGIEMSIGSARAAARAPADYIYADMEHNPLDLPALYQFHLAMADRAMVLKKGTLQPNVALMARFPPEWEPAELARRTLSAVGSSWLPRGASCPNRA